MKQTLDVINQMEADGIIGRYAVAGAVAAYNYIEPAVTSDLDILVSFETPVNLPRQPALISLEPIYSYLRSKGYDQHQKEGIVIEGWPVQFLPVASPLDVEALAQAEDIDVEVNRGEGAVKTRILRPEHIIANALRVGRPQDLIPAALRPDSWGFPNRGESDSMPALGEEPHRWAKRSRSLGWS